MSPVWAYARVSHRETATVAMRRVPLPSFTHGRDDSPQHEDAADRLVLGGLSGGHRQARYFGLLLQRQLGLRRYETAWMLLHKLRRAMVNAVREPLHGDVEIDDTWVGGPQPGLRGSRQLKGRKAAIVLAAVEKRGDASNRIRMAVVPDFKQTTMLGFVKQHVAPGSTVYTDGLKGFEGLQAARVRHVPRTQPLRGALRKGIPSVVPLADRAIGNLQQWLIGTYHGVSKEQLQVYLDEFVFRHNRRRQPMAAFQTLLGLGTGRPPTPYHRIRGARDVRG